MPAGRGRHAHLARRRAPADAPSLDHRPDEGRPAFLVAQSREGCLGQDIECAPAGTAPVTGKAMRSAPMRNVAGPAMRAGQLAHFGRRGRRGRERLFENPAAGAFASAFLCVLRDGKKIPGTHWIVPKRRTREAGWVVSVLFSVRASANRHAGSLFTYSARSGKTGLTKVKNFSGESSKISGRNEFPDGMFTYRR